MGGLADQRDAMAGELPAGCSIASGNRCRPGSTVTRPRMECDCFSAASDSSSSSERHQPLRLPSRRRPTPRCSGCRAGARTRTDPAAVWNSVEIFLCGAGMADVEGQRRLMEVAAPDLDAGGFAAQRLPSVRADHEARGQRLSVAGLDRQRLRPAARSSPPHRRSASGRGVRPRAPPARPSANGCRCCSRIVRGRFRRHENRTSGARISRPVSSTRRIVCNAAA